MCWLSISFNLFSLYILDFLIHALPLFNVLAKKTVLELGSKLGTISHTQCSKKKTCVVQPWFYYDQGLWLYDLQIGILHAKSESYFFKTIAFFSCQSSTAN